MARRSLTIALLVAACGGGSAATGGSATVTLPTASASTSAAPAADSMWPAPPDRVNHGSGPNGCFTRDELAARAQQAKSDNEATYVEALHRAGLEPIRLTAHTLVRDIGELRGPPPEPHVEERELRDHRRARVIVMPPTGGCGDLSTAFELARGGDRIWLVQRQVKTRRIDVVACGCPTCKCEPPSYSGCGGARIAATTILGYELPPGTDFAGKRDVRYVEDWVTVAEAMPPQPVCVPPPPPP